MSKLKLFFSILGLLSTYITSAQLFYLNYGYNGAFTNLSGINSAITNYNDTRPWLKDELKQFNYLDGLNITWGMGFDNLLMEFGYDFRGQKRSVTGTDLYGMTNTREVKVQNGVGKFIFGLMVPDQDRGMAYVGAIRLEFGRVRVKTRVYGDTYDKEKFDQISSGFPSTRMGPTIKIFKQISDNGLEIAGGIYYLWSLSQSNVKQVDEELNNAFYLGEFPDQFNLKPNSFGFTLEFGIAGGG